MKRIYRKVAVACAVMIGCTSLRTMAMSERPDVGAEEENSAVISGIQQKNVAEAADAVNSDEMDIVTGASDVKEESNAKDDLLTLQIPQKLGVVIDPWEMDGRGQIYSEEYVIRNSGETAGTLVLLFQCRSGENGNVSVRTEKAGLYDGDDKAIYMELVIEESRIALSEEGSECRVNLEPGGEVCICFAGELNENASEDWRNGDVELEGIYTWYPWDIGESVAAPANEEETDFSSSVEEETAADGENAGFDEENDSKDDPLPEESTEAADGGTGIMENEQETGEPEPEAASEASDEGMDEAVEQGSEEEKLIGTEYQEEN